MKRLRAVDLFAGCGGTTAGAIQAGLDVIWAANHSPLAVRYHTYNHRGVTHRCQDLTQALFAYETPDHDVLLASPECIGHTKARGKERKHHDDSRSTAWAVISAVEAKEPPLVIVENVEEFRDWLLYPNWKNCLERVGYHVTEQIINAADLGIPQNRRRLFVVASKKRPIHIKYRRMPHVVANEIIDWDYKKWSKIEKTSRAGNTMKQVINGRKRWGNKFLIAFYGSEKSGRSLYNPLGTVTTRDRHAVVKGKYMRMLNIEEYKRAMGFEDNYILPVTKKEAVHMLGNAVPPKMAKTVISSAIKQHWN